MIDCGADICMAGCYGDYILYVPPEAINRLPRWHEGMFDPDSGLPMGELDNEYDEDLADVPWGRIALALVNELEPEPEPDDLLVEAPDDAQPYRDAYPWRRLKAEPVSEPEQ